MQVNKTHGGKREGAGRKPRLSSRDEWLVPVTIRLPRELVDKLRAEGPLSEVIRTILESRRT